MGKLFGTDGIRGRANVHPVTPEMALALGQALPRLWTESENKAVVIGKDTRISGDMLEQALVSGILSQGVDVFLAGVFPTPGVAFLTASMKARFGIMVSASHNPFYDNGIKLFKSDGYKPTDAQEDEIEAFLSRDPPAGATDRFSNPEVGKVFPMKDAGRRYADFLIDAFPGGLILAGMKVVLDCSNGATFQVAPRVLKRLGAALKCIAVHPDGKNINDRCGSQHPEAVSKQVKKWGADIGLAFDGDGDRLIAVDEKGRVITGDQIIAICAGAMKKQGLLEKDTVVTTVMSNIGLRLALKKMGIRHLMAPVGDRYVLEEMLKSGAVIGGEDSGHMIFLRHHTTGDGILTALKLIEAMLLESKPLSELADSVTLFPQILMNVPVSKKPEIDSVDRIREAIRDAETALGEKGRVLVRYSGTQPLCRVMVEGPTRSGDPCALRTDYFGDPGGAESPGDYSRFPKILKSIRKRLMKSRYSESAPRMAPFRTTPASRPAGWESAIPLIFWVSKAVSPTKTMTPM